jgi:elongator complex protein 3
MKILELAVKKMIEQRIEKREDLLNFKRKFAKEHKIECPKNVDLLKVYKNLLKKGKIRKSKILEKILRKRPVRSLSGIVNISVLTKPYPCPGKCIFCPKEKGIPKSYLSGEPAVERAKKLNFDPFLQMKERIESLEKEGHPTEKIELRIIGGTFSFYPKRYQIWFVKRCFDAANRGKSKNLNEAQRKNEKAKNKIVGISVETRPDFIDLQEIKTLRNLGVTLVELGVQTVFDEILQKNLRGHSVKDTILATRLLKNAGFKVLYQVMPNLFGSNLKKDEEMFEQLFKNQNFRPDYLKIYPCCVVKEAPIYKLWKEKKFKPYTKEELINLLIKIKQKIPFYVRIQRISRDIPSFRILEGGAKILNLRQIVAKRMKAKNISCKCIRCREVKERYDLKEKVYLFREDYFASDGREIFLSWENKNRTKLFSILRLRIPPKENEVASIFPVLENSAIIREIQTFGEMVPTKEKKIAPQHRGLGKKLIKEAEKIVKKEFGLKKIAVISGVGVRDYWRKLGYKLKETYMVKTV